MGLEIIKNKIYVGCGLTHAPEDFKTQVEATKEALQGSFDVLQFLGTTAGTAADVYQVDIVNNVGGCDAFLGIMDEPSWGLGYETREAILRGKPVLLVAHTDSKVTRLALGTPQFQPSVTFERYEDMVIDIPMLAHTAFAGILTDNIQ